MTDRTQDLSSLARPVKAVVRLATVSLAAAMLSGCGSQIHKVEQVAGWSMIDAQQRHPIIVSEQPATLKLAVARGSDGLHHGQRAKLEQFLAKYRASDTGNGRIAINVPSGAPNEVAALRAVADIRQIVRHYDVDDSRVAVTAYHDERHAQPPIRISYTRYVAEAPTCGDWSQNVGNDTSNLPYPNLGCATQRNFAMQVANPADLLGPRTMSPALAESRDVKWEKFLKGESVVSKKEADERATTKSQN